MGIRLRERVSQIVERATSPAARPSAHVEVAEVTNTGVQRHHSFFCVFLISTRVLSLKLRVFSSSLVILACCSQNMWMLLIKVLSYLFKFRYDLRPFRSKNFMSHYVSEFR